MVTLSCGVSLYYVKCNSSLPACSMLPHSHLCTFQEVYQGNHLHHYPEYSCCHLQQTDLGTRGKFRCTYSSLGAYNTQKCTYVDMVNMDYINKISLTLFTLHCIAWTIFLVTWGVMKPPTPFSHIIQYQVQLTTED